MVGIWVPSAIMTRQLERALEPPLVGTPGGQSLLCRMRSGTRTASAPVASATAAARNPRLRPITSTTKIRCIEIAVSRIASMCDIASCSAESKPIV